MQKTVVQHVDFSNVLMEVCSCDGLGELVICLISLRYHNH